MCITISLIENTEHVVHTISMAINFLTCTKNDVFHRYFFLIRLLYHVDKYYEFLTSLLFFFREKYYNKYVKYDINIYFIVYLPHRCDYSRSFLFFFEAMNISAFNFVIVFRINIRI